MTSSCFFQATFDKIPGVTKTVVGYTGGIFGPIFESRCIGCHTHPRMLAHCKVELRRLVAVVCKFGLFHPI